MATNTSPLGFGLIATFCTVVLPMPAPGAAPATMQAVTTVQPTFGIGTVPSTGAVIPSTGSGRTLLLADVIRRISTARGSVPDVNVPTTTGRYGIELLDYVNADMTTAQLGQFSASIDAQIKQDERIANSRTTATLAGDVLIVTINLVDGVGPFKLVLAISTLTQNLQVLSP